ncbi:putative ATP-dependent DNA helicase YjcD, partial [termite gut metagenome]
MLNELDVNILDFPPSEFQYDIFHFTKYGEGNAVVIATAGSGKTTTILSAIKFVDESLKCLFVAFNKAIVNELKERAPKRNKLLITTLHSLGYSILIAYSKSNKNNTFNISFDEYKYVNYLRKNIHILSNEVEDALRKDKKFKLKNFIDEIIILYNLTRCYIAEDKEEIEKIAEKHGILISYDMVDIILKLMNWGKENIKTIDFGDMIWLPNKKVLNITPVNKYDFIFLDEAQDLNRAQIDLFLMCLSDKGRFCAVGDNNQLIYGFTGNDEETFERLKSIPNTKILPLSISYRCCKAVVKEAQRIVPSIRSTENAIEGKEKRDVSISEIQEGDMDLCR